MCLQDFESVTNMSDSADQVTKKKQIHVNNDYQSGSCSKMSTKCAQRLLHVTQSTNSNLSTQTMQEIADITVETDDDQNTCDPKHVVPVRVDNKAAERSRLYRARHREKINRQRRVTRHRQQHSHKIHTVSNAQNTDEIEQLTRVTSIQLSSQHFLHETQSIDSNQRVDNKAAERSRMYRERHKEKINERRRQQRQNSLQIHVVSDVHTDKIEQITQATNNQLSSNSHTQRQQRYYDRHKKEINHRKRHSRLKLNISQSMPTEHNPNYRERKKQDVQKIHSEWINNLDAVEQIRATNDKQGGPPPLIKLPLPKSVNTPKRENSDSDSPSPKRQRVASGTENTDEDTNCVPKTDRDSESWQHGNMNITASRVGNVGWGCGSEGSASDDEWADAPADIGSFLHTRLRVDGDNSADEESNDSAGQARSSRPGSEGSTGPNPTPPLKPDPFAHLTLKRDFNMVPATVGPKSGPTDSRYTDVVKLNDYLQHGRRPQFWEEHYVKRVMEAVRLKELEMKQAAEILGVSYGTLYGRYRDVYGCINRPYRAVRDFWQVKGPSEVLERLQRGEISLDAAASALGVSVANLAAHVADFPPAGAITDTPDFEPIPIEIDPSLRARTQSTGSGGKPAPAPTQAPNRKPALADKPVLVKIAPKIVKCLNPNASDDDDAIPSTIISTAEVKPASPVLTTRPPGGKWPSIRVASIDSLRDTQQLPQPPQQPPPPASPSQLMRTRPDLTIVAKKPDSKDEDT